MEGPAAPASAFTPAFFPQDLATAFQEEDQSSGKERLLLTAAVPTGHDHVDAGYEVGKIAL